MASTSERFTRIFELLQQQCDDLEDVSSGLEYIELEVLRRTLLGHVNVLRKLTGVLQRAEIVSEAEVN